MSKLKLPKRLRPLFEDQDRDQVICAHRRWAKTLYAVTKSIMGTRHHSGALTIKNGVFWILFPTYRQAKMAAWKMLKTVAEETGHLKSANETELKVEFSTGSEICLKGTENPDMLRGVGLDGCSLDEWAVQLPHVFTEIVRPGLADKKGWSLKTFTPKGKNHAHEDLVRSNMKHYYPADKTGVIPAEELALMKAEMSEDEFAQELLCQFIAHAGMVYPEFRKEVHVIEPREVAGEEIISVDYGLRNPTAILFAKIDYDGNIFITDEIYQAGCSVDEHCLNIRAIYHNPVGVIDPSTAAKSKLMNGIPYSIWQEFNDNGVRLTLAPNQVLGGINLVKQYFKNRKLFIFKRCENLISELENYRWKEKRARDINEPEQPVKANDHACLTGDTIVKLLGGDKQLAFVEVGDMALTENGYHRVVDKALTRKNADLWQVKFSNGVTLKGTAEHKVYTSRGKVSIDGLRYNDIMVSCKDILYSTDKSIAGTEGITLRLADAQKAENDCTLLFGSFIMDRFLTAMKSITSTLIAPIINSQTLPILLSMTTRPFICGSVTRTTPESLSTTLTLPDHLLHFGTNQRLAGDGIVSTQKNVGLTSHDLRLTVNFVAGSILRHFQHALNSVISTVAKRPLDQGVRVIEVGPLNIKSDVYNLTIDSAHQYFANGVLVANCDSLRYLIASRFAMPDRPVPPVKENTEAYFREIVDYKTKSKGLIYA